MSKFVVDDDALYEVMPSVLTEMLKEFPPDNELNHIFSRRFNHKMKKLLRYEKRTPTMRKVVYHFQKVAVVIIVMFSMTFAMTVSVEAYRQRFFEIVTTIWEEFTQITISGDGVGDSVLIPYESSYIPKGFSITERTDSEYSNKITYTNDEGTPIDYSQDMLLVGEIGLDTENADIEVIDFGDISVTIIYNKNTWLFYWTDWQASYLLTGNIDKSELVKMVESIISKK